MLKKTVLVAAAALAIAAGSIGSAETALAQGMMHGPMGHRHRVCKPIYKMVKTHMGHKMVMKKVKTGEKCSWVK